MDFEMQTLPDRARALLQELGAPPRLVAHHVLVHDVAHRLCAGLTAHWSALGLDREALLLGAALHDVGKTVHPEEIIGSGSLHEPAGERVLQQRGFPARVARVARTHGQWGMEDGLPLEDLLVALADTVWRGTRDVELEGRVAAAIGSATGDGLWMVHGALDDLLTKLADGAEERLLWQAAHPG
jgi:putative nucleotidyltransferase with HDIG domain